MKKVKQVITQNPLWYGNIPLVQSLSICPCLLASNTATNALGVGLIMTLILICTNSAILILRRWILDSIRIPIYGVIIALIVSILQILINAYDVYQFLVTLIPLIVTNCIVISRAEVYCVVKYPATLYLPILDGLSTGIKFTTILLTLGAIREIFSNGTLFDGADKLFGSWARILRFQIFSLDNPFLLITLSPGVFILFGFLLAIKYLIDQKIKIEKLI